MLIFSKKFIAVACLALFLFPFFTINAQAEDIDVAEQPLSAVAGEDRNVMIGRSVLFSAAGSTEGENVKYFWDFGDGIKEENFETTHIYKRSGKYDVLLTVQREQEQVKKEITVSVDKFVTTIINDSTITAEEVKDLQKIASTQGILLTSIRDEEGIDYVLEKKLAQKILEHKEEIKQSQVIILWTQENVGLQSLLEIAQSSVLGDENVLKSLGFANKNIISVTDSGLAVKARIAQSAYNVLRPEFILLASSENIYDLISTTDVQEMIKKLKSKEQDYQLLSVHTQRPLKKLRPWNVLSYLLSFLVNQGMSLNTIYLLFLLPIVATLVALARHVVGISSLGIYVPSVITLVFFITGLKAGILIFLLVLIIGFVMRFAAKKFRISFLPRVAIILTGVSLGIFLVAALASWIGAFDFISLSIFPILIIILLAEKFISAQIKLGSREFIKIVVETFVLSMLCYFFGNWEVIRNLVLGYPEVVLLTIVINFIIGRWSGLRLVEYYRFRKLIKYVGSSDKN